ncbi:MAG: hypothetical protein WBB82_09125 [Limnothrix sp.]
MSFITNILKYIENDPVKYVTAFATVINSFLASGALFISWKNSRKDETRLDVVAERLVSGSLALQNQQQEYIVFKVYNKSNHPILIDEVGIKVKRNKYINLVDLAGVHEYSSDSIILGTNSYTVIPGILQSKCIGYFLINYSCMRKYANQYDDEQKSSSDNFSTGKNRVINTYRYFQSSESSDGQEIKLQAYILTGSKKYFVGNKSRITLGNISRVKSL